MKIKRLPKKAYPELPIGTILKPVRNIYFGDGGVYLESDTIVVDEKNKDFLEINAHEFKKNYDRQIKNRVFHL